MHRGCHKLMKEGAKLTAKPLMLTLADNQNRGNGGNDGGNLTNCIGAQSPPPPISAGDSGLPDIVYPREIVGTSTKQYASRYYLIQS